MSLPRGRSAFSFVTQVNLTQITDARARDIHGMLQHLKEVSGSAIYYHTHRFLKQHQFLSPEPPNDFAYWVNSALQDEQLAEKLAAIDTIQYPTIRSLREKIILTIEDHLKKSHKNREAQEGHEFYFMQSISFVVPTPYVAWDLGEFADALRKISINSLYYHIFDVRLRKEIGTNDFSYWLETSLDEHGLAKAIAKMDPYTQTMEDLRRRVIQMVEKRIEEIARAAS